MAIYHLTVKTGSRASGKSAAAKFRYVTRTGRYARAHDEVLHTQSGNMPSWAGGHQAAAYWVAADRHERTNGRLFREVEFALPVELSRSQQIQLATAFAQRLAGGDLPFTLAVHAGGGTNPHCHVMISERVNDGIERPAAQWFKRYNRRQPERGGARKTDRLKPRAWLVHVREMWAEMANDALMRAGVDAKIDHRSLADQGIARTPGRHIGPAVAAMERRGIRTERMARMARIRRPGGLAGVDMKVNVANLRRQKRPEPPEPEDDNPTLGL